MKNQPQEAASLPEQLWYKINSLHSYFNDAANSNTFIHVSPNTWAWGAAIVSYVMANGLMKKHHTYDDFIPGGRGNGLHRMSVFFARHATNLLVATTAMAATYSYNGIHTPDIMGRSKPITVDSSLRRPAAEIPPPVRRSGIPVNPDSNACVISINPKAKPNC